MKTYTFHISLPGYGRVWRKLEMPAEDTLEDLHQGIQDAFDFDGSHLYSFFMSGRAWDRATEYSLPEDVDPWGVLEDDEDDEDGEDQGMPTMDEPVDRGEEAARLPGTLGEALARLDADPELRALAREAMMRDLGLPEFMADMFLSRASEMASLMGEAGLDAIFDPDEEEGLAGDVRFTTLESLNLKQGQRFLYLFDYGDDWRFNVRVHAIRDDADPDAEYPRLVETVGKAPPQYPDWEEEDEFDEEELDEEA